MLHGPLLNNIHLISHLSCKIFFIRKLISVHCYAAFKLSSSSVLFHSPVSVHDHTASMKDKGVWHIGGMILTGKNQSTRQKTCHNSLHVPNRINVNRSFEHHLMNLPMKFCCLLLYHLVYQNKYNTIDKIIFEAKTII